MAATIDYGLPRARGEAAGVTLPAGKTPAPESSAGEAASEPVGEGFAANLPARIVAIERGALDQGPCLCAKCAKRGGAVRHGKERA